MLVAYEISYESSGAAGRVPESWPTVRHGKWPTVRHSHGWATRSISKHRYTTQRLSWTCRFPPRRLSYRFVIFRKTSGHAQKFFNSHWSRFCWLLVPHVVGHRLISTAQNAYMNRDVSKPGSSALVGWDVMLFMSSRVLTIAELFDA